MNRLEIRNVKIQDPFWSPYMDLIREKVLPYQWEVLNDRQPDAAPSHAVKNFRIAAGLEDGEFYGEVFQDSDLAKWLEAAAYSLETHPDEELEKTIDEVIELIMRAQQEDGYLNTYFTIGRKEKEWTNLYECHEMYCSGHMMEASIAYYKATGKKQLLEAMCRNARHIAAKFGDAPELCKGYPGHQEIELALVKLYEVTGELEYLQLGKYFLEERGKKPNFFEEEWRTSRNKCTFKTDTPVESPDLYYNQSHQSIYEQSSAVGHAVRAMYMYAAMADVARETKDQELFKSCKKLWNNVVQRQMYITGAIGATPKGEAFTFDYDLPNETAYAETCASIGLIFFAHRMLKMDVNSNYGDVMERALYNVVLGAMSDDGKKFYYVNPMEIWPEANLKNPERQHVKSVRQKWFGCACCPPNIARLLSSLGQYIYSYEDTSLYVHLYIGGQIETSKGNKRFKVLQESNYPWEGNVSFKIEDVPAKDNRIAFRIPGWCKEWSVQINNQAVEGDYEKGYLYLCEG